MLLIRTFCYLECSIMKVLTIVFDDWLVGESIQEGTRWDALPKRPKNRAETKLELWDSSSPISPLSVKLAHKGRFDRIRRSKLEFSYDASGPAPYHQPVTVTPNKEIRKTHKTS